jgi:hypothetical protein
VQEVALSHRALLVLDDRDAFSAQDQERLLRTLAVIHRRGLPGLEHANVDPKLREAPDPPLEHAPVAETLGVCPLRLGDVDDEPAAPVRHEPLLIAAQPRLLDLR